MKATLVVKLVEAHFQGGDAFQNAVKDLASDEEKKGNTDIATRLRDAVSSPGRGSSKSMMPLVSMPSESSATYGLSRASAPLSRPIPKDKDSALDLFHLDEPSESLDDLVLGPKLRDLFDQVVKERGFVEKLGKAGLRPVQKILLCGPPGCGKTTAARALAHEMGLPIAVVRLDSLVSSYLGQTSTNLRRIFDALSGQPVVLLLDEFDAIAKKRDDAQEVGELKRIVISLLQNFDTLSPNIVLIAATNHPHLLDPAVWRRFDLTVSMELPDETQRHALLKAWMSSYPVAEDFDWNLIVAALEGLSGSRIKDILSHSAKKALFEDRRITTHDLMTALVDFYTRFGDEDGPLPVARALRELGVPLRKIATIVGIPFTTLAHQLKKLKKEEASAE